MTFNEKLKKTVIVVTHEQNLVNMYNKRVITIGEGGIADDKMPDLMYFAENPDSVESDSVREYGKILETGGVSEDEI